jgi:hypothetical protein
MSTDPHYIFHAFDCFANINLHGKTHMLFWVVGLSRVRVVVVYGQTDPNILILTALIVFQLWISFAICAELEIGKRV